MVLYYPESPEIRLAGISYGSHINCVHLRINLCLGFLSQAAHPSYSVWSFLIQYFWGYSVLFGSISLGFVCRSFQIKI